ncbi:hypothetical protein I5M27_17570 [Adhaeribacter sp. BT258]|uniref:DUF6843 domain-containing protein n=1 Tax=Adhaeribacter terrigena TaxID=2793070 RepID=A0ABS1C622_9BACT|nr:hypothetical protein [Adhaeribacter terrigena]MBK0404805.1 hypothetical protein [Adhaeribacter terrigena]
MKAKIGIIIIILAFAVSLNPYLLIFTIPAFVIGVILLWFEKTKIKIKVAWTLLPIVIWYPAVLLFMFLSATIGTATGQKLDFIFPKDFIGPVVVIDKMNCGQPINKIEGREVLNIPNNGILLYKGTIKSGYVNHRYFRRDKTGNLIEIKDSGTKTFWEKENKPKQDNEIDVFLRGMGSTVSNLPEPIDYSWMTLIVSSKDSLPNFDDFGYNKQMSQEAESLIRKCKK